MFTGIIQELGTVLAAEREGGNIRATILAERSAPRLSVGSSIAVNGACLTAVSAGRDRFTAEIVEETLRKTALGRALARKRVNLELPLRADGLIDGHLVLGHVDTTGTIEAIEERDGSWWFTVGVPRAFHPFLVHTGSIAVDGVSLTVAGIEGNRCRISIIPHTMEQTLFGLYRVSDPVNIEVDVIGKYVERMLGLRGPTGVLPPDAGEPGGEGGGGEGRGTSGAPRRRPPPSIDELREQGF